MLVLDSNTISPAVALRFHALRPAELGVPAIVEYELRYGLLRLPRDAMQPRMTALTELLHPMHRLPFDEQCAEHADRIRADLESAGTPIGPHDVLIAATALFAAGPWLKPKPRTDSEAGGNPLVGSAVQFLTSVYGGFFGAGMGIMMLATLGLTERGDYHHLNALKNMLSIVIAAVAIVVFVSGGVVAWYEAIVMIPGVAAGGYAGVWAAKRVPQNAVRGFVVAVGLFLAAYYFMTG